MKNYRNYKYEIDNYKYGDQEGRIYSPEGLGWVLDDLIGGGGDLTNDEDNEIASGEDIGLYRGNGSGNLLTGRIYWMVFPIEGRLTDDLIMKMIDDIIYKVRENEIYDYIRRNSELYDRLMNTYKPQVIHDVFIGQDEKAHKFIAKHYDMGRTALTKKIFKRVSRYENSELSKVIDSL